MLEPINLLTSILLRIRAPQQPPGPSSTQPPAPLPTSTMPKGLAEGQTKTLPLHIRDGGRGTPLFLLPKGGKLQIGLSLLGEQFLLNHPATAQSQTERIPLPAPLASHGELWLVRQPEQQFLLLWLPLMFPPIPLHQIQLTLQPARTSATQAQSQSPFAVELRYLKACFLFIALCILLALF